jgi:hypothetical protein
LRLSVAAPGDGATIFKRNCIPATSAAGAVVDLTYDGASWLKDATERPFSRAYRNLLINGDFSINQRGFAGGAVTDRKYSVDRWFAWGAGVSLTITDGVATLTGAIEQGIEAPKIAGQVVTVSLAAPSADLTVSIIGGGALSSGTIAAGGGRRGVTLTVPVEATGDVFLKIEGVAASFADVQLEIGAATAFDRRAPGDELALCQRYYQTWAPNLTAGRLCTAMALNNGDVLANLFPPVAMRIPQPTVTFGDLMRTIATGVAITGLAEVFLRNGNNLSARFTSGATTGGPYACIVAAATAAGFLTLDADF